MEDNTFYGVREMGQRLLGFSLLSSDGAVEQAPLVLLLGEDVLDPSTDFRFRRVGLRSMLEQGLGVGTREPLAAQEEIPVGHYAEMLEIAAALGAKPVTALNYCH